MDAKRVKVGQRYVQNARMKGRSEADIRRSMMRIGWTPQDIDKLLGTTEKATQADAGSPRRPAPPARAATFKQERNSLLLPLLVSVALALAIGWLQARSFAGAIVWRGPAQELQWWSWTIHSALGLGALCLFRAERRRQVWALVSGAAAGLAFGRLILPGAFGALIEYRLREFPDLPIEARLHWGQAWPLMAALIALVSVLVADRFASTAAITSFGRRMRSFVLDEDTVPVRDQSPPRPRPMKKVTLTAAWAWLATPGMGVILVAAIGVLFARSGSGAGEFLVISVLRIVIFLGWVAPLIVGSIGLLSRRVWGWWAMLVYASISFIPWSWHGLHACVRLIRRNGIGGIEGPDMLVQLLQQQPLQPLLLAVLFGATAVVLLRDHPRFWCHWDDRDDFPSAPGSPGK